MDGLQAETEVCSTAASIPVVGFNAVLTSEHFGAFFTFAVLHAALAIRYIKVRVSVSLHRSIELVLCWLKNFNSTVPWRRLHICGAASCAAFQYAMVYS